MRNKILSFNSSILVIRVEIKEQLSIYCSEYQYKQSSESFSIIRRTEQTLELLNNSKQKDVFTCLGCKIVHDDACGIYLPYLVVESDFCCYFFSCDLNFKWCLRHNFAIPKILGEEIKISNVPFTIENGPQMVWIVEQQIFFFKTEKYYSLNFESSAENISKFSIDLCYKHETSSTSEILWWDTNCARNGMIVMKNQKGTMLDYLILTVDNEGQAWVSRNDKLIPYLYVSIITCVAIISFDQVNLPNCSFKVLVATTHKQIVEFIDGKYSKHVAIPFSCCQSIQTFENSQGKLFLFCHEEDEICVIDWLNSEVFTTYQGLPSMLIDDFVCKGTSQVLLFNDFIKDSQEQLDDYVLTDCHTIQIKGSKYFELVSTNVFSNSLTFVNSLDDHPKQCESGMFENAHIDDHKVSEKEGSSIIHVVNALKSKILLMEKSICEYETEISEKQSFVMKHCENLSRMERKSSVQTFQTLGLGCVIELENTSCFVQDEHIESSCDLTVLSICQDVSCSQWIVLLEIANNFPRNLVNLCLCVVNKKNGLILSSSKTQIAESENFSEKTQIFTAGTKTTVIAIMSLPDLSFNIHPTVGLILTWKFNDNENMSKFCGEITLPLETSIKVPRNDCVSRDVFSSLKTQFVVSIKNTENISHVIDMLNSNTVVSEHAQEKYYLKARLPDKTNELWNYRKNILIIDVFSSDYKKLYLCLVQLRKEFRHQTSSWESVSGRRSVLDAFITILEKKITSCDNDIVKFLNTQGHVENKKVYVDSDNEDEMMEISIKRRKICQQEQNGLQSVDAFMHWTTFHNILQNFSQIDNAFLRLGIL